MRTFVNSVAGFVDLAIVTMEADADKTMSDGRRGSDRGAVGGRGMTGITYGGGVAEVEAVDAK